MSNSYEHLYFNEYYEKQTIEDANGVRRNPMIKAGKPINCIDEEVRTLHDTFMRGWSLSKDSPCLGWREHETAEYSWITYDETLTQVKQFASGLLQCGAEANNEQFVGIFSQNRVEWKIAEQACNSYSMVIVPLYDTLGQESIEHIVTLCELKIIVVDTDKKVNTLLEIVKAGKFKIDLIISMQAFTEDAKIAADNLSVKLNTFEDVKNLGMQDMKDFVVPKPSDTHTICFTSGTTGMPKGAILTHENLVANITGVYAIGAKDFLKTNEEDVHISYLPLAHVFERVMAGMCYMNGARVGFFQGDVKKLLSDVAALRPSVFPMVPRLINRLFDKIHQGSAQSKIKSFLLNWAKDSKLEKLKNGIVTRSSWWDLLVFKKIQKLFGGRARVMITGAAPVSGDVLNFMRVALGVYFSEGYGQTESTAAISISIPNDYFSGSVGTPVLCNEVKLVDVPEKEYWAKDGKGEVCAKGTNIFKGYYKDPEKTAEALDEDGWLHTGDIGMWLPNGSLKIIDRKKHIFKLSQGEYIAPEKIEQILIQSTVVAQVYVHGDSLKSSLVAIVVPDVETIDGWLTSRGVPHGEMDDYIANSQVNDLVLQDLITLSREKGLKSFEVPKRICLSKELFSVENNLLTPTFKSRRPQLAKRYAEEITEMYKDLC